MKIGVDFGIHEQALRLKARRAEVLSSNIANADPPGYKARDFDFRALLNQQLAGAEPLRTTHERHFRDTTGVVHPGQLDYRIPNANRHGERSEGG